jgi:hypothetical protein
MGMFRRRGKGDVGTDVEEGGSATSFSEINPELQDKAQEVMKDNLEMMKDIVMKVRDDPEFAKGIYKNCPRLQHLLDQYPDLRPIFENPKLVRINFEQVYRDAGGVLPEDEEKKKKSWLVWLVNSPIFKVLKLVLFVKKLVACIAGGGFAFVSGCLIGCCFEDALEELEGDGDIDDVDLDGEIDPNREALNRAADHMEDPEVQEQMQRLLEDPENLQDAIENDNELKALRDSNPLCGELMSDPETMRVLTDPDNLRALGEAPSLIEADFVDPDSFVPEADVDIESGMDGMEADFDGDAGFEAEGGEGNGDGGFEFEEDQGEGNVEGGDEGLEGDGEEDDEGWWEDAELEEQEVDNDADNAADKDAGNKGSNGKSQARGQAKSQQQQQQQGGSGMRGIMASIGVAATDVIAAQIVGNIFGDDLMGGLLGGGGDIDVEDIDNGGIAGAADEAGDVMNDDVAGVLEDTTDEVHESANESKERNGPGADVDVDDNDDGKKKSATVGGVATIGAGGVLAVVCTSRDMNDKETPEGFDDENEEEPTKKNKFFGAIKNLGSAVTTAAKEHVASAILGEDFGEALVEKMQGGNENDDEKEGKDGGDDTEKKEEEKPKKRGLFGGRGKR